MTTALESILGPAALQTVEGILVVIVSLFLAKWEIREFTIGGRKIHLHGYDLYAKWRDFRGFKSKPSWGNFKVAGFTSYQFVSLGVTAAFVSLMLLYTHFGPNLILLRVATGSAAGEITRGAGHYLVWASMFLVFLRYGYMGRDFIRGGFHMVAFAATHEIGWYIAYLASLPARFSLIVKYYFPFVAFVTGMIVGWWLIFHGNGISRKKLIFAFGFLAVFYTLWVLAGFHITIDTYSGNTLYYPDLDVNLEEDDSWFLYALVWL